MLGFLKKLFQRRKSVKAVEPDYDAIAYELWRIDFSKPETVRFDIKSEAAFDSSVEDGSIALKLKKSSCLAWLEDPLYRYRDLAISCTIRLATPDGYGAAGLMFRVLEEGSGYMALISSKGYFRLDVHRNGTPLTLIGWTEIIPLPQDNRYNLIVIAYGSHIVLAINSHFVAELHDVTVPQGQICFTCASYESARGEGAYTAEAFLESFSLESRIEEVEKAYLLWTGEGDMDPRNRLNIAETFAAQGQAAPALIQLKKAWELPGAKTQAELLLASRLALQLDLLEEGAAYSAACIAAGVDSPEGKEALTEHAKILYSSNQFEELKGHALEAVVHNPDDTVLWTLLGHAYWELGELENAAAAYDTAFEKDQDNGLAAKNGANCYELLHQNGKALDRYLNGGRAFLNADNYEDLGTIVPKLLSLGDKNWEAHGLAGKWAFGIENWEMAGEEFKNAEILRKKTPKRPKVDPAILFLQAQLLIREGKRYEALPLLTKATDMESEYPLFWFKLAECRFLLSGDPLEPEMRAALDTALALAPEDGWTANLAAQVALSRGDPQEAEGYLEKASDTLGDVPAIRVNRGVMYYLRGSLDRALEILESTKAEDPEGIMANCAGNLLVQAMRFQEADSYYLKAIAAEPKNAEFLVNRASCLIKLERYGEADEILSQAHGIDPSPVILELIAYVAVKKGEYPRAEAACRAALEMDSAHGPSLLSLGWICASRGQWEEVERIVRQAETLPLREDLAQGREELRTRMAQALYWDIHCKSCGRTWTVSRTTPPVKSLRLFAMPPDDLPAGSCLHCGTTYCIGCAQKQVDSQGRFLCPECGETMKLANDGLKKLIADWADSTIKQTGVPGESRKKTGRTVKNTKKHEK